MKTKNTIILTLLLLSIGVNAQNENQKWELPMKENIIYFQDSSKQFDNKKNDLFVYLKKVSREVNDKVRSILDGKGGKLFSNTNYRMTAIFIPRTPEEPIEGNLIIGIIKTYQAVLWKFPSLNDEKLPIDVISATIKIRLIDKNKYILSVKGFTVKGLRTKMIKGSLQSTDKTLEEVYTEFVNSGKKSKDQINFFLDIKELITLFETTLSEQLEHTIKVDELD